MDDLNAKKQALLERSAQGPDRAGTGRRVGLNLADVLMNRNVGTGIDRYDQAAQQDFARGIKAESAVLADQIAQRKKQEESDPNSDENRRAQELFAIASPRAAKRLGGRLETMTAADLDRISPGMAKALEREDAKAEKIAEREQELALKREERENKRVTEQRKLSQGLAKELRAHPVTRKTNEVVSANQRILRAAEQDSAAGDLALIFNYMKVLDPGSTVREGEFANAENSAGVPERIRAQYNKTISGQRLTPTMRADFVDTASQLTMGQLDRYQLIQDQYSRAAEREGADPSVVVDDQLLEATRTLATPKTPKDPKTRLDEIQKRKAEIQAELNK